MRPANDNARSSPLKLRHMPRGNLLFAGLGTLIALIAIVAGLLTISPPWVVRKQRLDEQRTASLNMISDFIGRYNLDNGKLPSSLDDLLKTTTYRPYLATVDPSTGAAYEYKPGAGRDYQLCATFDLASPESAKAAGNLWSHKAGAQCFDLVAPTK
jgi:type II secretory pathway pseudopilin PulG